LANRETIVALAIAAPQAPPQSQLDPELCPPLLDGDDAPDLASILDSVYRTPQGEGSSLAAVAPREPPAETAQVFPLVVLEPPPRPQVRVRRRRKRRPSVLKRLRESAAARRLMYALWAVALIAVVLTLLQLAR
jgi:hypothetical protein